MDIRKLVIQGIHTAFPDLEVYGEAVEQGFTPPCFSVQVLTASDRPYPGWRRCADCALVVQYFPIDRAQAACNTIAAQLVEALEYLPGNAARAHRMEWEITDGVLQFFVDYRCFYQAAPASAAMEEMDLDIEGR